MTFFRYTLYIKYLLKHFFIIVTLFKSVNYNIHKNVHRKSQTNKINKKEVHISISTLINSRTQSNSYLINRLSNKNKNKSSSLAFYFISMSSEVNYIV